MSSRRFNAKLVASCSLVTLCLAAAAVNGNGAGHRSPPLPLHLSETGLYIDGSVTKVRADNIPFSPQYPLWSDRATKRRWLHIPPGTAIDASRADAWDFPRGTKLWKEFSHDRPVETRLIERLTDGTWRYATYVWNEEGTEAKLAPASGIRALPVNPAPGGRYAIPSEPDCRACHEGAAVPVLGASALQLSPDRDPLAPHGEPRRPGDADLRALMALGWIRNLPAKIADRPPRIAAPSPVARAALGYLHGNCGHCHNDIGSPPPVDLILAQSAADNEGSYAKIMRSLLGGHSRYRAAGMPAAARLIDASNPEASVLTARMRSRDAQVQMPPLGTQRADTEALHLIERWIGNQLQP